MIVLILGVALWWMAHLLKRVQPDLRARLETQFGQAAKGIIAGLLVLSIVLMVTGYKLASGPVLWSPGSAWTGVNNLLMLAAFYLFAVAGPKGEKVWLGTKMRHPMQTGFALWAAAHLLVGGRLEDIILFGGLLAWTIVHAQIINRADGAWTPPARAPQKKEITTAIIAVVTMLVVMMIHNWSGVTPWTVVV